MRYWEISIVHKSRTQEIFVKICKVKLWKLQLTNLIYWAVLEPCLYQLHNTQCSPTHIEYFKSWPHTNSQIKSPIITYSRLEYPIDYSLWKQNFMKFNKCTGTVTGNPYKKLLGFLLRIIHINRRPWEMNG